MSLNGPSRTFSILTAFEVRAIFPGPVLVRSKARKSQRPCAQFLSVSDAARTPVGPASCAVDANRGPEPAGASGHGTAEKSIRSLMTQWISQCQL